MLDKVLRWLSGAPKRATSAAWANGASESRGRVLLEYPAHSTPSSLATVLRDAGCDVSVCEGPTTTHSCNLLEDGECGLVDGADVVVNGLGLGNSAHRDLIEALRSYRPDQPLLVEVPGPQADKFPEVLDSCVLVSSPVTASSLCDAVSSALPER